ncbi:dihydroxyacetone kinase family protein [Microbacterium cremeum]|uniref:dihydroxyacetone kinase family protein n=1 Tax=Microbacterium cremeum TaxID=2782169 RepID=UPI001887E2F0|nr:dihydroxyacetone kinase family protein [Microbacterium cremeum]
MKKIINAPGDVIEDYISGLVGASPHLARVAGWPVVVRTPSDRKDDERVALVSGGGSGHEPAHAGYVGRGMLDAAVLGPVFTSPSVDAVYAAIRAVATRAGVLLIVKNYTGDRLNFGLAAELARADGIRVEMVVVADDAALGDASRAGRRGLTATVLVHKLAGAAAERGWDLSRIVAAAGGFVAGAATMGVSLGPCFVPGAAAPNFTLGADEIEWGLGIHGEAGAECGPIVPSAAIAARLVDTVVGDSRFDPGTEVVALVNALGGTPDLDLRILQGDILRELAARDLSVRMTWAGPFLTSLEMPGASLTVAQVGAEELALLADEVNVLAFPRVSQVLDPARPLTVPGPPAFEVPLPASGGGSPDPVVARTGDVVEGIARALIAAEPHLTELDRTVGDGDLGVNLARAAETFLATGDALRAHHGVERYLAAVSDLLRHVVGGTSGPLYSLLVLTIAEELRGRPVPTPADWIRALAAGVARIREVGGAAPGDSTMIDALQPAVDVLQSQHRASGILSLAVAAARAGADSTASLTPSLGRSSYVGERAVGVPDPGAVAVAIQFEAAQAVLRGGRS